MGYYIEGPSKGKAKWLMDTYDAEEIVAAPGVILTRNSVPPGKAIVCVVDNGLFEAAAYGYNNQELADFQAPWDLRPKRFIVMDEKKVQELTRFKT